MTEASAPDTPPAPRGAPEPMPGAIVLPTVAFTPNLQRHVASPDMKVGGRTVADALDAVFRANPKLRSYVLDEHGAVRQHIVIWAAGTPVRDRDKLSDPVGPDDEVYVMQALSGG